MQKFLLPPRRKLIRKRVKLFTDTISESYYRILVTQEEGNLTYKQSFSAGSLGLRKICTGILLVVFAAATFADSKSFTQSTVDAFANSNIVFQRGESIIPFLPLANITAKTYGSADVTVDGADDLQFEIEHFSQAAGLPFLLDDNNVLIVGEYLARTNFSTGANDFESFHTDSIGLPIAWLQQVNQQWHAAAFIMPLGHKSSHKNSSWQWETLGGAFLRYEQSDKLWWAYGVYADIGGIEDIYLPYAGVSWTINENWSLSAIMPWPALLYAPSNDLLFRLGASPSSASWQVENEASDISANFDAWDFGFTVEKHVGNNFWLGLETGIGGLRGLRIVDGDFEGIESDVSASAYFGLSLNFRPSMD
ncbi:MAG: hypothetical protein ACI90U_000033 [Pseudomonadales bacterium]|jgi:hypothetical protein